MGQEFIIKSTSLEDKINQLLPSQGGSQAGVDLSASTTIIPIVDLTESAEGSLLRQDLQKSLSLTSISAFDIENTTTTLVATTGYYRVFGSFACKISASTFRTGTFALTDGISSKNIVVFKSPTTSTGINLLQSYDFLVYLKAGDSLTGSTNDNNTFLVGNTRQVADINGNLVNPL